MLRFGYIPLCYGFGVLMGYVHPHWAGFILALVGGGLIAGFWTHGYQKYNA